MVDLSTRLQALLVQLPAEGGNASGSTRGAALKAGDCHHHRRRSRSRSLLQQDSPITPAAAASGSADASSSNTTTSSSSSLFSTADLQALVHAAGGPTAFYNTDKGYYDDWDYSLLHAAVHGLRVQYAAALCAVGYQGTLCGSCAAGYGSTGPARCSRCPTQWVNTCYYVAALAITLGTLAFTLRELLEQVRSELSCQRWRA